MDNRYYNCNCPALMSDGRHISSYVRGRVVDQYIRNINNINSAHDYKLFLQDNTLVILDNLNNSLKNNNTCILNNYCNKLNLNNLNTSQKKFSVHNNVINTNNFVPYEIDMNYQNYN